MTPATRRRALVASIIALALLSGTALGVVGDRLLTSRPKIRAVFGAGDMSAVFDRLDLTAEQRRQAEAIVSRSAPRSEAIMIETAERLRGVADSVDAELRTILTSEQRLRLDSLRRGPSMVLRRKVITPGGSRVDTVYRSP